MAASAVSTLMRSRHQERLPVPWVPSIDILKVVAGLALYAVDSLLMDRPRAWNYKEVSLDGDRVERQMMLAQSADCPSAVTAYRR